MRLLRQALSITAVLTILTGLAYPLAVEGLAQLIFPAQANGSLIMRDGRIVGSRLIEQKFLTPRYFHGRPSAAGPDGYDAADSGGSNLAPTNKTLIKAVRARLAKVLAENPGVSPDEIPIGLVTTSGSGLDPDISPAAAEIQVDRVAKTRELAPSEVAALVRKYTRSRWLGIFGEPRVNVLMLNIALDNLSHGHGAPSHGANDDADSPNSDEQISLTRKLGTVEKAGGVSHEAR